VTLEPSRRSSSSRAAKGKGSTTQGRGRGSIPGPFLIPFIHRSAWKDNSANFALTEFLEVREVHLRLRIA
jgi:hypothetical protein